MDTVPALHVPGRPQGLRARRMSLGVPEAREPPECPWASPRPVSSPSVPGRPRGLRAP